MGQSDNALYEPLRDFIYQQSEKIGTDNAYSFTAYGLDILGEILPYAKTEDEILDQISEQADRYTPIYYNEISEWLVENVSLVDEIKAELGSETGDTYKDTQVAYCITLERITNDLYELIKELKG